MTFLLCWLIVSVVYLALAGEVDDFDFDAAVADLDLLIDSLVADGVELPDGVELVDLLAEVDRFS